jgi:hypothetical protein
MIGAGLTSRIVDCYAAVISVWQPGDRIYIFGYSRGAYTARCLAHVLELVGIPTKANGGPLSLEPTALRRVAKAGVKTMYVGGKSTRGVGVYSGPCTPPNTMPHHYTFVLIATDFDPKELPPGLTRDEVVAKIAGQWSARARKG